MNEVIKSERRECRLNGERDIDGKEQKGKDKEIQQQ